MSSVFLDSFVAGENQIHEFLCAKNNFYLPNPLNYDKIVPTSKRKMN